MEKLSFIIVSMLITHMTFAQQEVFEKSIDFKDQRIDLQADFASQVSISNWDKREVKVKITYELNGGELNEAVEIDLREQEHRIRLKLDIDERMMRNADVRDCEKEDAMTWGSRNGPRVCADIFVEVFLPKGTDLVMESVIADILVNGEFKDLDIKTVTGDIDLTWPEKHGADIQLKTVNGSIYTNFDFKATRDKGLPIISSHDLETIYKDGGRYMKLETVTSDIYLRKG
ncbi:hypothetical protein BFP97_02035 [Roseivirga sp. 4D4]|uniref:hypothetical protein n=1 Tax=Roseivirga sp. 4D4 TaxID=1889784 RepID=UPI000852F481|nr:hypothetical protein [Roseivirga sp. 4D4]OEK00365.1 hypothetical protein BFP97_02035 [Roseivirga sp. 4D4]